MSVHTCIALAASIVLLAYSSHAANAQFAAQQTCESGSCAGSEVLSTAVCSNETYASLLTVQGGGEWAALAREVAVFGLNLEQETANSERDVQLWHNAHRMLEVTCSSRAAPAHFAAFTAHLRGLNAQSVDRESAVGQCASPAQNISALNNNTAVNTRPIVGIMSEPWTYTNLSGAGDEYIAASYVKLVEGAGGRVVPLHYTDVPGTLALLPYLNGVIFPGGAPSLTFGTPFMDALKSVYDYIIAANDGGVHYPLMCTCLGYEALHVLVADNDTVIEEGFNSENLPLPLAFSEEGLTTSRMFAAAPPELIRDLAAFNITMNNHQGGVGVAEYWDNEVLVDRLRLISVNADRNGRSFTSTVEDYHYPLYGTQWHPEKNAFEWTTNLDIPHCTPAVTVTQYIADFMLDEARQNFNAFPTAEMEQEALIYNYEVFQTVDINDFEQCYIF